MADTNPAEPPERVEEPEAAETVGPEGPREALEPRGETRVASEPVDPPDPPVSPVASESPAAPEPVEPVEPSDSPEPREVSESEGPMDSPGPSDSPVVPEASQSVEPSDVPDSPDSPVARKAPEPVDPPDPPEAPVAPEPSETPPPPPPRARRRPWWRSHVPFMLAAAVLAPIAFGLPWWEEHNDNVLWGAVPADAAPAADGAAALAGTRWEFLGARTGPATDMAGVTAVDAVFELTPQTGTAAERLHSDCRARAVDAGGRLWEDGAAYGTLPDYSPATGATEGGGCRSVSPQEGRFPVGEGSLLMVHFAVPRDSVSELRFEVEVATHDPADTPSYSGEEPGDPEIQATQEAVNPPEPAAVSFAYRELQRSELVRRGFIER